MIRTIVEVIENWVCRRHIERERILNERNEELSNELEDARFELNLLEKEYADLEGKYLLLLKNEDEDLKPPNWLDTSKKPYQPVIQIVDYNGKIVQATIDHREIYTTSPALERLVKRKKWKELNLNKKLIEIWKYIIREYSYRYDYQEAWRFPQETYRLKYGDCEDTTVLFVTLCKVAKVPADYVFNCCGYFRTSRGEMLGHSFPIAKMEDGKWYVFETTLNIIPAKPLRFKGSNYYASWGLSNWKFGGKIRNGEQI